MGNTILGILNGSKVSDGVQRCRRLAESTLVVAHWQKCCHKCGYLHILVQMVEGPVIPALILHNAVFGHIWSLL